MEDDRIDTTSKLVKKVFTIFSNEIRFAKGLTV